MSFKDDCHHRTLFNIGPLEIFIKVFFYTETTHLVEPKQGINKLVNDVG